MPTLADLHQQRLHNWRQTSAQHISNPEQAIDLIHALGLVTLYPASPEVPNLFSAFTGDPDAPIESSWDSPTGEVYGWRWTLGKQDAAFYTALVRKRPTWIAWEILPVLLCLCGEMRTPDELYDAGILSPDALRIATSLDEAGAPLSTGELRKVAGFPTGKPQRAAFLKAVEELDTRLLLAKVFASTDEQMSHALVAQRYPQPVAQAHALPRAAAIDMLLQAYFPHACYIRPLTFAKHLRLPAQEVAASVERLVQAGKLALLTESQEKDPTYWWV